MLSLPAVLTPEQIASIRSRLEAVPYRDGALSVGAAAKEVKFNVQADLEHDVTKELQSEIQATLMRNMLFKVYARPRKWARLLFSQYGPGQSYGRHYDNWEKRAMDNDRMRSDLSFTLFLSEPDTYEGGELMLERHEGPITVKMPAGCAFVYPTGVIHQVMPVTSGVRHVCVGWVQSHIRSEEQRTLLLDLELVLANLEKGEPRLILDRTIGSLLRMWGEV